MVYLWKKLQVIIASGEGKWKIKWEGDFSLFTIVYHLNFCSVQVLVFYATYMRQLKWKAKEQ